MKSRHHWLLYVGGALFFFVVVPYMLVDSLARKLDRPRAGGDRDDAARRRGAARGSGAPGDGGTPGDSGQTAQGVFDGDWNLTAGQLLLRWYSQSPSPRRLVLLTPDRVCVAASPRRRLSPTKAGDFRIVAEFPSATARIEGEAGGPRGFATFRIRFADASWIEVGNLGEPDDADHFLRTVSA